MHNVCSENNETDISVNILFKAILRFIYLVLISNNFKIKVIYFYSFNENIV